MAKDKHPSGEGLKNIILELIRSSSAQLSKRDIARKLDIKGDRRRELKAILAELEEDGVLERSPRRKRLNLTDEPLFAGARIKAEIIAIDDDGELIATPLIWEEESPAPQIYVILTKRRISKTPTIGTHILIQLKEQDRDGHWWGQLSRLLPEKDGKRIGIFSTEKGGGRISSCHRKDRSPSIRVSPEEAKQLNDGDIVSFVSHTQRQVEIDKTIGHIGDPKTFSIIAINAHGLPHDFSEEALAEAEDTKVPPLGKRTDLRKVPLVTIDGADARDFDDAVHAEADTDPRNEGGWRVIVAIADVAHYVRPHSALDKEAWQRGNSVYFPDMVVPMLPEALSNGLCSLRPNEDRACMFVEMVIGSTGKIKSSQVKRGLMKSCARLTYTQVENAINGEFDEQTEPLKDLVIKPLVGVYKSLNKARQQRGTLNIHQDEQQIHFRDDGYIDKITTRPDYTSHKVIEELMVAANVATAKTLQAKTNECMYRVHERPNTERVVAFKDALRHLKVSFPKATQPSPQQFNQLLEDTKGKRTQQLISELVLRTQSAAQYSLDNHGHFGLGLSHYCHFTSPIRRYADLIVHRMLIDALDLGEGGYGDDKSQDHAKTASHISSTERQAMLAERDAMDRFVTAYYAHEIDKVFKGTIAGVTKAGLFVRINHTGAQGFVPMRSLKSDYFQYNEASHRLVGRRSGLVYQLGDEVEVVLREADITASSLLFNMNQQYDKQPRSKPYKKTGKGKAAGKSERSERSERSEDDRPSRPHKKTRKSKVARKAEKSEGDKPTKRRKKKRVNKDKGKRRKPTNPDLV